jgi:hypothetical protein
VDGWNCCIPDSSSDTLGILEVRWVNSNAIDAYLDGITHLNLVEPLAPRRKTVFGRLQTFVQLGRAPARPESKCVLQKSKPERVSSWSPGLKTFYNSLIIHLCTQKYTCIFRHRRYKKHYHSCDARYIEIHQHPPLLNHTTPSSPLYPTHLD